MRWSASVHYDGRSYQLTAEESFASAMRAAQAWMDATEQHIAPLGCEVWLEDRGRLFRVWRLSLGGFAERTVLYETA